MLWPPGWKRQNTVACRNCVAFVIKLRQDLHAVQAAVVSPFSQGPVEGHIHRLKLLKRSMYGRGNFDLLKQRVLYAANLSV